ncbi:hypothetical protein BOX15_Mlig032440g2 [Macrostomum lignano]|uniref:Homeobox domain-containing protein n=1 Tax=Macrostomum lignano TaxID=282301 RepID=A0A267ECZ9_9PLAT|nr:hypothetical protein BOX15_Mlig032440g2 [Macrostomum lignano]
MRYSAARSKLVYLCPCCRCGCSAEGDSSTKFNALRSHLRSAHSVSDEQLERFIEMADTAVEEAGGRRRQRQQRATPPAASKEDEQAEGAEVDEDIVDVTGPVEEEQPELPLASSAEADEEAAADETDFVITCDPSCAEADILLLPPTAESPGEEQQQFRCQACHVTAASLEELLRHQREAGHHRLLVDRQGQAAPGYLCWRKGCNQYFPDLDTLQMHFTEIHAKTTRSAGGDAELPSSGSAAAAASSARFPHACAACRLAFRDGRQLERHRRQHAASRLACLLCHQRLGSSVELRLHYETLHLTPAATAAAATAASVSAVPSESSPTGGCGEVYRCEQCQVGFGAQIQLAAHMRSNTHKRLASCRCPLCGLACAGPEHLRSHAKSHQLPLFLPPLLLPFPLHPPHPTPSSMSAASLAVPPPPPPPLPPHSIAASSAGSPPTHPPPLLCHFLPPLIPSPLTKPPPGPPVTSVAAAAAAVAAAAAQAANGTAPSAKPAQSAAVTPAASITMATSAAAATSVITSSVGTNSSSSAAASGGSSGGGGAGSAGGCSGDGGSDAGGGGGGGGQQNGKRARTRITEDQLRVLKANFNLNSSPNDQLIAQMSGDTGLPVKVIKHWFRNTLFKERQRCKDSPYNFSIPPATQLNLEEYEKTGKVEVLPARPEEIEQHVRVQLHTQALGAARRKRPRPSATSAAAAGDEVSTAAAAPAAVEAAEAASGRKRARIERRQPTPASQIPSDSSWLLGCRTAVAAEEEEENPELDAPLDLSTAGQQQQQRQQPQTPAAAGLPSPQQAVALRLLFEQQQQLLRIDGGAPSEPQVESVAAALGLPGRLIRAWLSNNVSSGDAGGGGRGRGSSTQRSPSPAASWLGLPGGRCRLCAGELPADSPASEHLYTERHLAALLRAAESAAEDDGTDDNGKTVREVAAEPSAEAEAV